MLHLKFSELEGLTAEQIEQKVSPLIDASFSPPNGSLDYVKEKIENFELSYQMTSQEMLAKIESGQIEETDEIADWAIEYSILQDLSVVNV